ncbi:MAG: UvrD-helicase domain-containing protein, partial [bacterium]
RVIVHRILRLMAEGMPAGRILALTFTNKAAGEMRDRLAAALGPGVRGAWVGTFHAVGARILRAEGARLSLPENFVIVSRGECLTLLKREMAKAGVSAERYEPRSLLGRIGALKTAENPIAADSPAFSVDAVAARLAPGYTKALRAAGALDFDDLLALPLRLLREHADVLAGYRERFAEILVDEYQDTNAVQNRLVRLLAGEARRVFAVGDDDQSIYRWRGADVENIRRFERDFPGARVFRLERNYRSSGRILAAAGAVMARARGRRGKRLFTENPPGAAVRYLAAPDPETEAEMLFQRLAALGAGGEIPWAETAVFYRTNTQSRPLEEAARRRGIPYQVVKGQRFFDRAEVQDLAAYLRLILRPEDASAFVRILNRPPRGLGPARRAQIAGGDPEEELTPAAAREALDAGRLGGAAGEGLAGLLDLLEGLAGENKGPAVLLEAVLEWSGYRGWLRGRAGGSASPERRREAERALEGAAEFVAAAEAFEERAREEEGIAPGSPEALGMFLEELALAGEADELDFEGGRLSLMTLHAAKGLEFRAVGIAGAQEGFLPHGRSAEEPESLEEERRLLYVGMTRAREHLLLSWARERKWSNGAAACRPSRFLEDLGEDLIERVGDHAPPARSFPEERESAPGRRGAWYEAPGALAAEGGGRAERLSSVPSQALGPFAPGARVEHPKFGAGVVAERSGTGDRAIVTVEFEQVGRKKLVLRHAPLRPAGDGVDAGESAKV